MSFLGECRECCFCCFKNCGGCCKDCGGCCNCKCLDCCCTMPRCCERMRRCRDECCECLDCCGCCCGDDERRQPLRSSDHGGAVHMTAPVSQTMEGVGPQWNAFSIQDELENPHKNRTLSAEDQKLIDWLVEHNEGFDYDDGEDPLRRKEDPWSRKEISGLWCGWEDCLKPKERINGQVHDEIEFHLGIFERVNKPKDNWHISGFGTDDLGSFLIRGKYNLKESTICLAKWYSDPSTTCPTTLYKGQAMGASIAHQGVVGIWKSAVDAGAWHLWPVNVPPEPVTRSWKAIAESHCADCGVGPPSTKVLPCSHIAVCRTCAMKSECRICRKSVCDRGQPTR